VEKFLTSMLKGNAFKKKKKRFAGKTLRRAQSGGEAMPTRKKFRIAGVFRKTWPKKDRRKMKWEKRQNLLAKLTEQKTPQSLRGEKKRRRSRQSLSKAIQKRANEGD